MLRKLCAGVVTSVLIMGGAAACSDDDPPDPELETNFVASLSGAAERPTPVTTSATGSATVTIDDASSTFAFSVTVKGLLSPFMAHIHVWGVDVAVPIALSLLATAPPVGTFNGVLASGTGTAAQVVGGETFATLAAKIRAGTAYINVHTVANQGGEIRGQLVAQ